MAAHLTISLNIEGVQEKEMNFANDLMALAVTQIILAVCIVAVMTGKGICSCFLTSCICGSK